MPAKRHTFRPETGAFDTTAPRQHAHTFEEVNHFTSSTSAGALPGAGVAGDMSEAEAPWALHLLKSTP